MTSWIFISTLLNGCSSKTAMLDTALGEPSTEPSQQEPSTEPSQEEPGNEPSQQDEDNDDDGVTTADGDCDDGDPETFPGAADIADDGIDQDCDGSDYTDGLCSNECAFSQDADCDDGGPFASSPLCDLGTDCSDCGTRDDNDQDGFYDDQGVAPFDDTLLPLLDCNDENEDINPQAQEIMNDGIDQDCNGSDLTALCTDDCESNDDEVCDDGGSDAAGDTCALGTDCNDCGDRIDGDMDGFDDEQDCDDGNPDLNPEATDECNGFDEDCDGFIDEDFDETEPNDANNPFYMGSVDDGPQLVSGHIAYEGDQDGFHVNTYDGWSSSPAFTCTISAPPDLDLDITLLDLLGATIETSNTGMGGEATVGYGGSWFDDTGNYLILIDAITGDSCSSSYTISCQET